MTTQSIRLTTAQRQLLEKNRSRSKVARNVQEKLENNKEKPNAIDKRNLKRKSRKKDSSLGVFIVAIIFGLMLYGLFASQDQLNPSVKQIAKPSASQGHFKGFSSAVTNR